MELDHTLVNLRRFLYKFNHLLPTINISIVDWSSLDYDDLMTLTAL